MRVLCAVALFSMIGSSAFADETLSGVWYGTMDVGVREFRFRIEPTGDKDSPGTIQLVSIDEGGSIFRLDNFRMDDSQFSFELKTTKAAYTGTRSDDGKLVSGKWKQAGAEFDLLFRQFEKAPADSPTEVWSGSINTLFQKLSLRIRVYQADDGSQQVRFDSVSQKAGGFKAERKIDGDQWTIDVKSIGGVFLGTANADLTEVKGKWTQGGSDLDLTLVKDLTVLPETTPPVVRPQTPKPPFPYLSEDVAIETTTAGVTLAGTLTLPKTKNPCIAAILITGSGPQDRDETLLDHKPFAVIADHLTRNGIAVLRFDDRGTAASTGDITTATSEDFANDVEAVFQLLLKDQRIDARRIGLIGHSEGGLIAPMVAVRRDDVAFAVLLAGTGVNGREILLSQGQLILKAEGVADEAALRAQRESQTVIIEAASSASGDDTAEAQVQAAMEKLESLLPPEALQGDSLKKTLEAGIATMKTPWFQYFLTFEPGPILEQVNCPVLALNGEKDVQVDPKLNLPAIRAALEKGGNSHFETIELPGLNHLFQTCTTGSVREYQQIEETISPLVLDKVTSWILENARE